ncbi:unnamed protein product [Owenia fusiformis]|uniref:VWFA domain-containing protein n=1 Tax=Owenia fusiformis TaxID=6347 RepID=A0A8S4PRW9_OWEFU|nr:unnamed protein product [Owenia fusiformis]
MTHVLTIMKNILSIFLLMCITLLVHAQKELEVKKESEYFSEPGKSINSRCHQENEYYIVQPSIFGDVCDYYKCVNTYYEKFRCPPGRGVGKDYLDYGKEGIAHSLFPCSLNTEACALGNPVPRPDFKFCGFDLIWVVDMSCSIADESKAKVVDFIYNVIKKFHIGPMHVLTGGLSYGSKIHDIQTLKEGRNKPITLKNFKNMVQDDGSCKTVTYKALKQVHDHYFKKENGDRPDYQNIMIFISDGITYEGRLADNEALSQEAIGYGADIKKSGTINFVLGMPNKRKDDYVGMKEWGGIASSNGNVTHIYLMESFDELAEKVQYMAENICLQSTLY